MPLAGVLKQPFAAQLAYFRQKENLGTEHWDDILGNAHDKSFVVAGATKAELLADLREAVDKAISTGTSLQEFRRDFAKIVQKHGWTDYQGEFGWRTKIIYETNMRASYAAGRYAQLTDPDLLVMRPFWRYVHNDSVLHPRPLHVSWDGLVLKHDDPWWRTHFPPGGWGCRCRVVAASKKDRQAAAKTQAPDDGTWQYTDRWGEIHTLPRGIDYGWGHTPGAAWKPDLARLPQALAAPLGKDLGLAQAVIAAAAAKRAQAQAAAAAKALAVAEGSAVLARSIAQAEAAAAAWKLQEALSGNLGKWYQQAAKLGLTAPEDLDAIAAQLKAAHSAKVAVANYKKALVAGKEPKPAWSAAFAKLPADNQAAIKSEIAEALGQARKAAVGFAKTPDDALRAATNLAIEDVSAWKQVGPQSGSNPGGLFEAPDGARWYVKFPAQAARAHSEMLAAELYRLAGIEVPELRLVSRGNDVGVASRIIEGLKQAKATLRSGKVTGVYEGFATDAWLANWDVVGLGYDNLMVAAGRAIRVDTGGALLFRARGASKGAAFGKTVGELDSLRDAKANAQAAAVFGKMTEAQVKASVARVLAIREEAIRETVARYGFGTASARADLTDLLLARQADLAKRFPDVVKQVSHAIEAAADQMRGEIKAGLIDLDAVILSAIKGIATRASTALELKDIERVAAAATSWASLVEQAGRRVSADTMRSLTEHYQGWIARLQAAIAPGAGAKPVLWSAVPFAGYQGEIGVRGAALRVSFDRWLFAGDLPTDSEARAILQRAFGDAAANMDVPKGRGSDVFRPLPIHYQRAIVAWTGSYFARVTKPVLQGKADKAIMDYVRLLDQALAVAPNHYQGVITRGMAFSETLDAAWIDRRKAALISREVLEFTLPASYKRGQVGAWGASDVNLHIVHSTRGVYVRAISLHPNEDEVLMPRFKYRVVKYELRDEKHHLWLEEVEE